MRPTAMQRPADKEVGKIKKPAPPPPQPKHASTIAVVSNSADSRSSPGTRPREAVMNGTLPQSGEGGRANGSVHRTSVTVGSAREKQPPPVSPRDKQGPAVPTPSPAPSAKSPVPAPATTGNSARSPPQPRPSSGAGVKAPGGVTVTVNGSDVEAARAPGVTGTDFFSSLPSLPPSDYVAPDIHSPTPTPDPTLPPASPRQQPSPPPPQAPAAIHSTPSSTKIVVSNSSAAPSPPPVASKPAKAPQPPPVSRKPIVSRPPTMTGISENGSFLEEKEEEEEGETQTERFYVRMNSCNGGEDGGGAVVPESTFAGRRDVRDPRSLQEKEIVSVKGTVRGFKNRVRAGIVTFVHPAAAKNTYGTDEAGQIVVYNTSMSVVRETSERCKRCRNILHTHMVRYQQRDLYMNLQHQRSLKQLLNTADQVPLPQIFIDGVYIGGANDLERLNETGELRKILQPFPKIQVRTMCDTCGGYRFVPCAVCHGSKKSVHRNNFTEEFCALRCMHCNENGLQRCRDCADQQE